MSEKLKKLSDTAEEIGVVGSPSTTRQLTIDVLGQAADKKLVGSFTFLDFMQDNKRTYALGQITEIQLINTWAQDATMRSLIRQKGKIDPITEKQDTHTAEMALSSIFMDADGGFEPTTMGTVPCTGTAIKLVSDELLDVILENYKDEIFYLGNIYGSAPKLPMWFKHFDSGRGGAGEAYHIGIFGKSGSGKSVLAKMMLVAYARHKEMAVIVLDPQGEFSKKEMSEGEGFQINLHDVSTKLGTPTQLYNIGNLILDDWEVFENILFESNFLDYLHIPKQSVENRENLAKELATRLQKTKQGILTHTNPIQLHQLADKEVFKQRVWTELQEDAVLEAVYKTKDAKQRLKARITSLNVDDAFSQWEPFAKLFSTRQNGKKISDLIEMIFAQKDRPMIIIDLSRQGVPCGMFWNDNVKAFVIKKFLDSLTTLAEKHYQENKSLNTLVVIDEAHRLAPRERFEDDDKRELVKKHLEDAARTTRKYGLGWLFISQTISSLSRDIIDQLRIYIFGFGLGMGLEYRALSDTVGGNSEAQDLYRSFRDPHSTFDTKTRQFPFMVVGPVSPLSFSQTPLFFTAFNSGEKFLKENKLDK